MGGISHPATAEQLSGIEHSLCWRRDHVVFRVITHLREAIGENECMGHFDLPEDLRADRNIFHTSPPPFETVPCLRVDAMFQYLYKKTFHYQANEL